MAQGRATTGTNEDSLVWDAPLFIRLARRGIDRGQHVHAAIRLLEGVRKRPEVFRQPVAHVEIMTLLTKSIRGPGLEDEILDVDDQFPGFLGDLCDALEDAGASHVVVSMQHALDLAARERSHFAFDAPLPVYAPPSSATGEPRTEPRPVSATTTQTGSSVLDALGLHRIPTADMMPGSQPSYIPRFNGIKANAIESLDDPEEPTSTWFGRPKQSLVSDREPRHEQTSETRLGARDWLRERVGAAADLTPPPIDDRDLERSSSDLSDPVGLFAVDSQAYDRSASREDLLSHAAAACDSESRSRRARTHGVMADRIKPKRTPWTLILCCVAVLSAIGALGPFAYQSVDRHLNAVSIEGIEAEIARGTRPSLERAQDGLSEQIQHGDAAQAAGLAALTDALMVARFDARPGFPVVESLPERDPLARLGQVILLVDQGAIQQARQLTEGEVWATDGLAQEWALAEVDRATGAYVSSAERLARVVDGHALAGLALLDLAEVALEAQSSATSGLFLERVRRGPIHPFVGLAKRLLTSEPLEFGDAPLVRYEVTAAHFSNSQRSWYALAGAYRALVQGDADAAAKLAADGLALDPDNLQLAFLDGVLLLQKGEIAKAAPALIRGTPSLANSARGLRYRAEVVNMIHDAGRPDLVLSILGDTPMSERPTHEVIAQVEALVATGRMEHGLELLDACAERREACLIRGLILAATVRDRDSFVELSALASSSTAYSAVAAGEALFDGRAEEALEVLAGTAAAAPDATWLVELRAELMSAVGDGAEASQFIRERYSSRVVPIRRVILDALFRARAGLLTDDIAERALGFEVTELNLILSQVEIAAAIDNTTIVHDLLAQARPMAPDHPRTNALLGLFTETGRGDFRVEALRRGRQGHISVPGLWMKLGRVHGERGELDAALEAYAWAMQRPSVAAQAIEELGGFYIAKDQRVFGRRALSKHLAAIPNTPETRLLRGHLAYQIGILYRPSSGHYEAARHLKAARVLLGERAEILRQLGVYFRANGVDKVAEKFFTQAREIEMESVDES